MTSERYDQNDQITERGVERPQDHLQSTETSAYCIGYTDPALYAEALARAGGETTAVEPDEAWETEDAVSLAEAEHLALARWRELGAPITIYERVGYRAFPHPDPELAAAGVTDCAWDEMCEIAWVGADGQLACEEGEPS